MSGCPGCGSRAPFHNAAYCQIPPLSDDFKKRPWLTTPIRKPTKPVTDLPLFLGEKEKHEVEQEQSQKKLF